MISYRTILFGTVAVLAAAAPATATSNSAAPALRPVAHTMTSNSAAPAYRPIVLNPFTSNSAAPALIRLIGPAGLLQLEEAIFGLR